MINEAQPRGNIEGTSPLSLSYEMECGMCCIHEDMGERLLFVMQMPNGMDMDLGSGGLREVVLFYFSCPAIVSALQH